MIKELCVKWALLLPILAYADNAGADLPVQIVRAESDPAPPTAARAAGFTTLAANYDFSQPQYAVQSTWLDCDNTNDSVVWHRGSPGITSPLPCNINQEIDPTTRQPVLAMTWLTSQQSGNVSFVSMQTYNNGGRRGFTA